MPPGLATTFETLTASRNDASNAVLRAALTSSNAEIHEGALQAIIARRCKAGHLAILKCWHQLPQHQRDFLQEGRGRMSGALRDAVLADDEQLFANACELVEQFTEFDLIPTLVTLAENQKSIHAQAATDLVLRLVKRLSAMLHQPRDYTDRRDPQSICRFVLECLERSVERFRAHNRGELIEAFVILSGANSATLRGILDDPHHPCYLTVINTLTKSQSDGVIEFLLRSLQCDRASLTILNVIGKRNDSVFVEQLLKIADAELPKQVAKNIRRIRSFRWLEPDEHGYTGFDDQDQVRCIKIAALSGVKPDSFLDLLENILKEGESIPRWVACEALASIPGDRGNQLVLDAIEDPHPKVQAAATRQIRDRHVPGAMALLLKQIDSPQELVRAAARVALKEFSFANFLVGFEALHDDVRRTTGNLVKKVDPECSAGLLTEMESTARHRRLRAVEMAEAMELVPEVSAGLLRLLEEDNDNLVRAAAADALRYCPTGKVQSALRYAANDQHGAVQSSAKQSLAMFDEFAGEVGVMTSTEAGS